MPAASCALRGGCGFCGSLQTMPQRLRALLSSSARLEKYRRFNPRYFSNRLRKPATGSFAAERVSFELTPFSFCEKETKTSLCAGRKEIVWQFIIWKQR